MKRCSLILVLVVAPAFGAACAHHPSTAPQAPAPPPAAPQAPPAPSPAPGTRGAAPRLGDGVQWFRSAAEYRAIAISTYRNADEAVTNAVKAKARDSWAVVLDADETVLDNSVFQRDLSRGTAPFSEELWAVFVRTRSSIPVPGAKAFLDHVKELG